MIQDERSVSSPKFYSELLFASSTFIVTFVLVRLVQTLQKWKRMPPGPWGFPLLGYLPLLGKSPHKTFDNMREKYGDIFCIRMGSWPTVVLNSRELIYEAFVNRKESFADRPRFFSATKLNDGRSLGFGKYDDRWKMHRKIGNNVLRMFANLKNNPVEESIQNEAFTLTQELTSSPDADKINPHEYIFLAVGSVLHQICYGKDKNCKKREDFRTLVRNTKAFIEFTKVGNPVDIMPWLRYFMPWKVSEFLRILKSNTMLRKKQIEVHLQIFDKNNLRDAADGFINSAKELEKFANHESGITSEDIYSTLEDIIGAGFETVSTTLEWSVLYMTMFPEVQHKVQKEIDDVIGDRQPGLKDKGKMPYTEATILEVLRMCTITPLGLPRATTDDVTVQNYFIPKGTVVFANLYAVSYDKNMWKNPEEFRPERFLTSTEELDQKAAEYVLNFGAGRRRCIGEFLAKVELFVFFATLMQQCHFEKVPELQYSLEGVVGLTHKNIPYKIKVSDRF